MNVRVFNQDDLEQIVNLFYNSVHQLCQKDYSFSQLDAWAPLNTDLIKWKDKLNNSFCLVVEIDHIIGFANIDDHGHFDCLYVDPQFVNLGIGSLLLKSMENYALGLSCKCIEVDVSKTALNFFNKNGYQIVNSQQVCRNGIILDNYHMIKKL